jgi:hypothetical protein
MLLLLMLLLLLVVRLVIKPFGFKDPAVLLEG